jgi:hypothetical protein
MAERHPLVQRAVANFRWTGSWRTVFITVDRLGGAPVDAAFEAELRGFLERFRLAGTMWRSKGRISSPGNRGQVCVAPGYFASPIRKELLTSSAAGSCRGASAPLPPGSIYLRAARLPQPPVRRCPGGRRGRHGEITTFQRQGLRAPWRCNPGKSPRSAGDRPPG